MVIQGQAVKTTAEHPFYLPAQERFVPAGELEVGDQLVSSQGVLVPIESISNLNEITTVYNLRVADHHTYFVGGALWGWDVWVHNAYQINTRFRNGSKLMRGDEGDLWYLPARLQTARQVKALAKADRYGSMLQTKVDEIASGFSTSSLTRNQQDHLDTLWKNYSKTGDKKWIGRAIDYQMKSKGQFVERELTKWIDQMGLQLVRKSGNKGIDYQDPVTGVYYELLRGSTTNIRSHAYREGMTDDIWRLITFK